MAVGAKIISKITQISDPFPFTILHGTSTLETAKLVLDMFDDRRVEQSFLVLQTLDVLHSLDTSFLFKFMKRHLAWLC